jgi:Fur family ferric uptake transcriptional regulator
VKRRNTPSKQEILDILKRNDKAMSQDMIMDQMSLNVDRVTVYRILNTFCDDGVTHKVIAEDGKSYFALCQHCEEFHRHDHFHFQCTICNKIECLEQFIDIKLPTGYIVKDMNCIVSGICSDCNK